MPSIPFSAMAGLKCQSLTVHHDTRGHFVESYRSSHAPFIVQQHNVSYSGAGVLRGLHYQQHFPQAKLLRVLQGCIFDVVVDVRAGSPTFGCHTSLMLYGPEYDSGEGASQPHEQLFIPAGFAHGFYVVSDGAIVEYACDRIYQPGDEQCLLWNDPALGIAWPTTEPIVSAKDQQGMTLHQLVQTGCLPYL